MVSSAYVWAKIYGYMEEQLGSVVISTFFDDVEVVDLTQDTLILYTSSDYRRDVIISRYTDIIHEALRTLFNSNAKLIVYSDEEKAAAEAACEAAAKILAERNHASAEALEQAGDALDIHASAEATSTMVHQHDLRASGIAANLKEWAKFSPWDPGR